MAGEHLERLKTIQDLYRSGGNILQHLKQLSGKSTNDRSAAMISYDFQAGSYIAHVRSDVTEHLRYVRALSDVLNAVVDEPIESLLEAGVGEATTLAHLLPELKQRPRHVNGFDLAWSRIKYGQAYLDRHGVSGRLFVGDLFHIPLPDDSIDLVYTAHSVELNGGQERRALEELYRVTRKLLVLFEPGYEFATAEARARMEHHGYVKNLGEHARALGYTVLRHELIAHYTNPLNPTAALVIAKPESRRRPAPSSSLACPITRAPLREHPDAYFCPESLLAYPKVAGIPCLLPDNAIVATHFDDEMGALI